MGDHVTWIRLFVLRGGAADHVHIIAQSFYLFLGQG